jgi:hypothetical protein
VSFVVLLFLSACIDFVFFEIVATMSSRMVDEEESILFKDLPFYNGCIEHIHAEQWVM